MRSKRNETHCQMGATGSALGLSIGPKCLPSVVPTADAEAATGSTPEEGGDILKRTPSFLPSDQDFNDLHHVQRQYHIHATNVNEQRDDALLWYRHV